MEHAHLSVWSHFSHSTIYLIGRQLQSRTFWIASVGDQERILSIITDLYLHMHPRLGVSQALVEFDTSLDSCDVGSSFFWDCEFEFSWAKPLGQQQVSTPNSSTLLGI